jgi:predicted GTPase
MTQAPDAATLNLSLVSHTNVGKTSLMRTLLRRDIGEVADRPHVTERAEGHTLLETAHGDVLRLWDTPGFGDTVRLLKRLRMNGNPLGWLLTHVWDRFADRPFFCSQQAIANVRDESDVVLYLVNAAEDPTSAAYVEAELEILAWTGKPVLLLLNQMGPARPREAEAAEEAAWSAHLAAFVPERGSIGLDAFARCWVQEDRLLEAIAALLSKEKQAALHRLRDTWRSQNLEVFESSIQAIASQLAATAVDREVLEERGTVSGLARKVTGWLSSTGSDSETGDRVTEHGMDALAKRLDEYVRENTDRLIALHGLSGRAKKEIQARMAAAFNVAAPADVRGTGVLGGVVTGALGGLAADLSAGGLTFGAGALIGGIVGALGGAGAAKAYNLVTGVEAGTVRWSPAFLTQRAAAALLRYLSVAHYGRGRGDWVESEYPTHWRAVVDSVVRQYDDDFQAAWSLAQQDAAAAEVCALLEPAVRSAARETLVRLYPQAADIFAAR